MFYDNVKFYCSINDTNITQLARDLGLSTSMPTKWKHGAVPKADTLKKIADHFGVTTDDLLASSLPSLTVGNVSGSSLVVGNRSRSLNVSAGGDSLTAEEAELLRLYRGLDMRARFDLMGRAYELADKKDDG